MTLGTSLGSSLGSTRFGPFDPARRRRCGSVAQVEPVPSTKQLLRWGETLAAIARTGLGFTESLYEQERFEEILRVAADIRVGRRSGYRGR